MNPIFFTSDEHHGHRNIITFCNRPFTSLEEMTETLIERHNAKVPKGGLVYHLGDMFWRTFGLEQAERVMERLNGQHFFVWGNHDELIDKNPLTLGARFVWKKDIARLTLDGFPKIVLCHYPFRVWRDSHNGSWHLYGHVHGVMRDNGNLSLDVGVDANDYAPVSLEEVMVKMWKKQGEKSWKEVLNDTAVRTRVLGDSSLT